MRALETAIGAALVAALTACASAGATEEPEADVTADDGAAIEAVRSLWAAIVADDCALAQALTTDDGGASVFGDDGCQPEEKFGLAPTAQTAEYVIEPVAIDQVADDEIRVTASQWWEPTAAGGLDTRDEPVQFHYILRTEGDEWSIDFYEQTG